VKHIPKFKYSAKNFEGSIIEGVFEASTHNEVIRMLRERDYYPLKIEKIVQATDVRDLKLFGKLNSKDIAMLSRQFSTMMTAGISIIQCLDILTKQVSNRTLGKLLAEIYDEVRTGETLSGALEKRGNYFPSLFVHMTEAGEMSGTLDTVLDNMARYYEEDHKLKQKIKMAMTYPAIVIIVAVAVVYFLLTMVVPTFVSVFQRSNAALPLPTRLLLWISGFLAENGIIILLILLFFVLILYFSISRGKGRYRWHGFLLKIPVLKGLIEKIISVRFTGTLGILLRTGTPLLQALEITKKVVDNQVAKEGLQQVQDMVKIGGGLSMPLESLNLFPPMVIQMVKIGEESGTIDEMLLKTAEFFEGEVDTALARLTTLMEPVIIIFIGGIVAFIVLSIAMPMFDMMSLVS
jgi:type IV pilus assembly protein PilC